MNDVELAFNEYVDAFKQMNVADKRKEVIRQINEITAIFNMFATRDNIEVSYLKNNEINDLSDGYETEDDYLEALLVYIENAKSVLGQYLSGIETNKS